MNFEASKYDYLSGQCVTITDRFWISILHRAQEVTLPDVWTKFEQDGSFDNFRYVAKKENHTHNGFAFTDGLIYETLRAASDLLHFQDSTTIREQLDRYISLIAEAQNADPDGFISTYTTTEVAECRFGQNGGKIQEQHDLYNAGALFEAAYHHYRVTHKTNLLSCAVRLANYLCTVIGKPPKKNIVAGHQLVEEALLKLYWLFREEPDLAESMGVEAEAYLELSAFLVEMRGRHEGRVSYPQNLLDECQDRIPIRHETEAVGHAVRAALYYTGASALAIETEDVELKTAMLRIWKNVTERKLHISGGIGAIASQESFGYDYQILNDAYLETCASVALTFWAGYMGLMLADASPYDVMERAIYNNILSGVSSSGNRYFYQNPLMSKGDISRWAWHGCPCCPPMYLKMVSCIQNYIYALSSDTLRVNFYIDNTVKTEAMAWTLSDRTLRLISLDHPRYVKLRVPEYAVNFRVSDAVSGNPVPGQIQDGYWTSEQYCVKDDCLAIRFDEPIRRLEAHPYIWKGNGANGVHGKVAIQKGVFLYCAEEMDNNGSVEFVIAKEPALCYEADSQTIVGKRQDGGHFRLIPYYQWNNREQGTMAVWLKQEGYQACRSLSGWENRLYREWHPTKGEETDGC